MQVNSENRAGVSIVKLSGELRSEDESRLSSELSRVTETESHQLVVDLAEVRFISSAGLGALVAIAARANTLGGRVILAGASPFVQGVLATTRLDRFFETAASVDDALALLRETKPS